MISESLLCLALAIFHESRGEIVKGKYMVAEVVHNRTKDPRFPDTYCGVVKQKGQFSWFKSHGIKPPKHEKEAWKKSLEIAKTFKIKQTNYTNGATYFNTTRLGVRYKTDVKPIRCGSHIFY